ncbi:hypothetical protein K2173_008757 [Erythroxylum novogranatense]|uniref:non-specific serine/threonine protein kinase n=1 Tax=Erythroxylum novogranatense TaxID=1862640 RepID=A0AAV8S5S0_9ROSI|nr:hypothetical protein K2173_008757 [Erythroxylum novogranatense]
MNGLPTLEDYSQFVEVDPTGRYGRYNEVLGKGASKTVYRAFDEYDGIEVAWNQVKLYDFLQSPEDLERLYCEIHLLKTLKHENIMKFYTSWVDTANRNINFVTEMFTSGTLRQYRLKHRRVNIRAVKHWCRQILKGLVYLHSHDPPIIHRDLKCDNIFINGNQGEVKIGDLGLAAILKKSHAARCVGTPEFMAPEVYNEEYNELVDIYSFGMCVLEMVTFEYPYSECNHAAQIYKKVVSGKRPDALYKVEDPEVQQFVEKCLATVCNRLSARELLNDPFLQTDDYGFIDFSSYDLQNESDYYHPDEHYTSEIDLFSCQGDEHLMNVDIAIKGRRKDDDVFLRLRIADEEGKPHSNIYFPFDVEADTALSVANEMVAELDIHDQDVLKIAEMIDGEIATLESPQCPHGYLLDHLSSNGSNFRNLQVLQCSENGCAAIHGRFEEVTYHVGGPQRCIDAENAPISSEQINDVSYTDIWAQREAPESSSHHTREIFCVVEHDRMNQSTVEEGNVIKNMNNPGESNERNSASSDHSGSSALHEDYENEIRQELRWLKAKYQIQLQELRHQQLGVKLRYLSLNPKSDKREKKRLNLAAFPPNLPRATRERNGDSFHSRKHSNLHFSAHDDKSHSKFANQTPQSYEAYSRVHIATAKAFYAGAMLPHSLSRATSLPLDALDV